MTNNIKKSDYVYAHIDCDCFFVSVELINKPWLKGKPVCVAGPTGNSGVVTCASYEARPYGIRAGTPVFKAKKQCPKAVFINGDFNKYGPISFELFKILETISPKVEHSSIDEGYIDLTNLNRVYNISFEDLGKKIQNIIWDRLKIPISIGIAPTKTLAKLASDREKPRGLTIINNQNLPTILKTSKISDVCGFGRKLTPKIQGVLGVKTLEDFIKFNPVYIRQQLGMPSLIIWHELQGMSLKKLDLTRKKPQSILRTAMFPEKTNNKEFITDWILLRLTEALQKLNRYQLKCQTIGVIIRKNHPDSISINQQLQEATSDFKILKTTTTQLLDKIYKTNQPYRAAGIWLGDFIENNDNQLSLFSKDTRTTNISSILNLCDEKFGKNKVTTSLKLKNKSSKTDFDIPFID